jgi:hypothetical protein
MTNLKDIYFENRKWTELAWNCTAFGPDSTEGSGSTSTALVYLQNVSLSASV